MKVDIKKKEEYHKARQYAGKSARARSALPYKAHEYNGAKAGAKDSFEHAKKYLEMIRNIKKNRKRAEIITILQELSASIEKFRDKKTGMWYQVTDQMNREGNYLESSASAMFIYTWVKGAQNGYLDKSFLKKGEKAYSFLRDDRADAPAECIVDSFDA